MSKQHPSTVYTGKKMKKMKKMNMEVKKKKNKMV